jgi:uncharacterized membrane protein YdjX (TVP38/TMEM64 family)
MKKLIPWIFLVIIAGIVHLVNPTFFSTVWKLVRSGNIIAIADYIRSFGIGAFVISILINIFVNLSGIVPTIICSSANGIVFGLIGGILASWIGEATGTILAFVLYRSAFRSFAEKLIAQSPYLKKVDEFSSRNGFKAMVIARMLPVAPSSVVTMVGAVSSMTFFDFFWATWLGKFPSIALEVVIGHDLVFAQENKLRLTLLLGAVAVIYAVFWYVKRKPSPPSSSDTE